MRKVTASLFILLLVLSGPAAKADFISTANNGTKAYKTQNYKAALELYRTAEADNPTSPELDYNIGSALYQQNGYEEALDKFQKALRTTDINVEAAAHYNMGNTYFKAGDYEKAIKSYEEALKLSPQDMDAKFNLELTRKKLKDQIKPQQNQDNSNKSDSTQQQKQDDQNQKDKEKQDQQQQQNQDQQNQQNKQDKQDQQQQPQEGQKKPMSKEDAERILNALKDSEQDIQKKIKRETVRGEYGGKDW